MKFTTTDRDIPVKVFLQDDGNGSVNVMGEVPGRGNLYLLNINENGVFFFSGLGSSGLPTDETGELRIDR